MPDFFDGAQRDTITKFIIKISAWGRLSLLGVLRNGCDIYGLSSHNQMLARVVRAPAIGRASERFDPWWVDRADFALLNGDLK